MIEMENLNYCIETKSVIVMLFFEFKILDFKTNGIFLHSLLKNTNFLTIFTMFKKMLLNFLFKLKI